VAKPLGMGTPIRSAAATNPSRQPSFRPRLKPHALAARPALKCERDADNAAARGSELCPWICDSSVARVGRLRAMPRLQRWGAWLLTALSR
jgi:hypothetical protein